ncbi:MAG: ABC transporter substrate-binding protein [Armatimonadetes bacterium]|nr:ABC transporter substrate-binding protein [Armatimonadota bacterium]
MNYKYSMFWTAALGGAMALSMVGCKSDAEKAATSDNSSTSTNASSSGSGGKRPTPTGKGNSQSGDTIKLGVVASVTGDLKPWGDDSYYGAKLAIDEFNTAGGLNGKKIELLMEDSASKPEAAKTAGEKLMGEGVLGVLGEVSSGNTEQIARPAFDKGIPVIAIGATKTTLTDIGANVWRVCYTDDFQGPVMARFAYEDQGIRKAAIITDKKQPYSQGLSESFKQYFLKLGGEIVSEVSYQTGDTQFQAQLTELKSTNPQGIFMSGYFPEVGPLAAQARAAGITAKFFGGDGWDSSAILQSGGDAIIGSYFCNHYNNKEARPEVKMFLDKFKAKYGKEPSTTMAALGYDAALVAIDALKRCKTLDSASLIQEIENVDKLQGVSGEITLKGHNGNPPKRALVVEIRPASEGFQVFKKAYDYFESK